VVTGILRCPTGYEGPVTEPCSPVIRSSNHRCTDTDTDDDRRAAVARDFAAVVDAGGLDLPHPGGGSTRRRWALLSDLAADDLCLARLAEAHVDAVAILAELGGPAPVPGSRWGVWAARPPSPQLTARRTDRGWVLVGTKPWCSGAHACTHALVTAEAPDGYRLFAVVLDGGARPRPGTSAAVGMAAADTLEVEFPQLPATSVGGPGAYLDRPGFWWGAMAVAACWYGGAVGVARVLAEAGSAGTLGSHGLAHLGAVEAVLSTVGTAVDAAAGAVDDDPDDLGGTGERRALALRAATEAAAVHVLERVGRALGAGPVCFDARHARLVADLPVYLRQSHAERDLARLGALVAGREARR